MKEEAKESMIRRIYGYARISTPKQNIDRQIRNIESEYPDSITVKEAYTGTRMNRPEWLKIYKEAKKGDMIVFDSVSRMSRNAEEGFQIYQELFDRGVDMVFLKEHHIDSQIYREKLTIQVERIQTGNATNDKMINGIMDVLHEYTIDLVRDQIRLAFDQAQKEVDDLKQRTREGIETARLNGKQIGLTTGTKLTTKKSIEAKKIIRKKSKDFDGTMSDTDLIKVLGIARNTFYKYKNEMKGDE